TASAQSSSNPAADSRPASPLPPHPLAQTDVRSAWSDPASRTRIPRTPGRFPPAESPPTPSRNPSASSPPCTPQPDRTEPLRAAWTQTASPSLLAGSPASPYRSACPSPLQPAPHPLLFPLSRPYTPQPHRPSRSADASAHTAPQWHAAPDRGRW